MPDDEAPEREPATTHADLYGRHGEADPSKWDEQPAVTGRPNDTPLRGEDEFAVPNSTLAERARAAKKAKTKQVDSEDAENKAVRRRRSTRRK